MKKTLEIKVKIQIRKPANVVFEAIVDPEKMSNYFISKGSGRMEEGKKLTWQFPEFKTEVPVRVGKIEKDRYVCYYWEGSPNQELPVEIFLEPVSNGTIVTVTEKGMKHDDAGIEWLARNTEGWANFIACLKAYLEHGINLRTGAFDFMSDKT